MCISYPNLPRTSLKGFRKGLFVHNPLVNFCANFCAANTIFR